jgi:3-oxoacyl-[acyl-carrier-protein] synthase II
MTEGPLPSITRKSVFDKPYAYFRRLDEYSRLGLAAIAFALRDAGRDEWTQKRNIGIIASTEYGCLKTDIEYFDTVMPQQGTGASPALFSYTLPNSFLGEAAIRFGLTGPTFVINEQVPLGPASLQMALDSIACGEADMMLCGVCNLGYPSPFSGISKVPPGALFFMVEKSPGKERSYGKLRLNKEGHIEFMGSEITDLNLLVQQCLAGCRD